jgi:hypothetical protein
VTTGGTAESTSALSGQARFPKYGIASQVVAIKVFTAPDFHPKAHRNAGNKGFVQKGY